MKKRTTLRHILTAIILALSLAVALPTTMSVDAAGAKLNKTKVTVCTGKTYTLKMSGISKTVKWSTSDKKVVSISKKSGKFSEKCTIKANKKGTATVTAKVKVGKKTKTFKCKVTVKGHSYGDATYQWSSDKSKCTATKECTRCHKKLSQTVKTSKKTTTKATCAEKGKRTYTAKFSKYDFGTKKKNVSIKALGHSFDKVSYKWASDSSSCTAKATCSRCKKSVSEKAKITSKVTKQATKDATGVRTYTATFKNKAFATQTKNVSIPKVAYLDKTSVTIRSDRTATVKVVNDTIASVSSNHGKIKCTNDTQSVVVKTTDKLGDAKGVVSITTARGTVLRCDVVTEFTPGDYNFGEVTESYQDLTRGQYYNAYGKNKGFSDNGFYDYVEYCATRNDYDQAWNFYNNQLTRSGNTTNLMGKSSEINGACSERRNYKSKARLEWEALSYEVQENTYDDNFYNYVREKYGEAGERYHSIFCQGGGFNETVTTNAQLKKIVDDWTAVSNEVPSWYYYTAMSDWAEWSGADLGHRYDGEYDPLPPNYKD